jgi:hypothetical protein
MACLLVGGDADEAAEFPREIFARSEWHGVGPCSFRLPRVHWAFSRRLRPCHARGSQLLGCASVYGPLWTCCGQPSLPPHLVEARCML